MGDPGPWDLAHAAAARAGVELLALTDLDDADRISSVIAGVWGDQLPPREIVRALQHAGCVLYGAESGGRLLGFVLGFAGLAEGLHIHSHMLGVVPECQGRGVGYALKLAQRAASLDAGIDEVRWTYDPLQARNARFNLAKLGTIALRFLPNFYGEMTDRLNRGDRSDRFEVRWQLTSERVRTALGEGLSDPPAGGALLARGGDDEVPRPRTTGAAPEPGCTVAIPRDHQALKARDPALARAWREAAASTFTACFDEGLAAVAFTRAGAYVFAEPPPPAPSAAATPPASPGPTSPAATPPRSPEATSPPAPAP